MPSKSTTSVDPQSEHSDSDCDSDHNSHMASSHTSDYPPPSPQPSVYSLTDSLYENSFKKAYDRLVNNYSDIYHLPADQEEIDRLDMQHILFQQVMGPLPHLQEILDTEGDELKAAIDLGCGSGSWMVELAHEFPNVQVVGVDLIPVQPKNMPPNCRVEVDDLNLGIGHFSDQFNVVNARLISLGIKDYASLIDEVSRVVRPGGIVSFTESDYRVYDEHKKVIDVKDETTCPSAIAVLYSEVVKSIKKRGGCIEAASMLETWVKAHPAYTDVVYRELWIPTSPFLKLTGADPETDAHIREQNFRGELLRQDLQQFLKALRVLLLGNGIPEARVDDLRHRAWRELESMNPPAWAKIQQVYARRKKD